MLDKEALFSEILSRVGSSELERVRLLIGSKTLREAIYLVIDAGVGIAQLKIEHYWAVYYHDGRGPVTPIHASKLIFFDDPADDPRLDGGRPERASDVRVLTKEEYEDGLERNRERFAAGRGPFMFVVDSVGPSRSRPFFDQLANNASNRVGPTIARIFDRHVQEALRDDDDLRPEKGTADFRI